MISCYQDLLDTALASGEAQRLLVLLLRADSVHQRDGHGASEALYGEGTLSPVMARDFALDETLTLDALVTEADQAAPGWQFMVTAVLVGRDGRMPSADDAVPHLKRMAHAVMTAEQLDRYALFDRHGNSVHLEAATP